MVIIVKMDFIVELESAGEHKIVGLLLAAQRAFLTLILRPIYGQGFLSGLEDYCVPEYEDCDTEVELTQFEQYELYNRSLGFIAGVLSIMPTAIFIYPVLLTSPDLDILLNDH